METDKTIKIMMAEDHDLVRKGFVSLLRQHKRINVTGEASHGGELLELLKKDEPDIIITDISMPVMDGFELVPILKSKYPKIKIIILSMHVGEHFITEMIMRGAHSFLPKNCNEEELFLAINGVLTEGSFFNESISKTIVARLCKEGRFTTLANKVSLTYREEEVLKHISDGKTNKQITVILNISEDTVESHRKNIYKKTNSKNIVDLVKFAIRNGVTGVN